jgi:hypothetical protein
VIPRKAGRYRDVEWLDESTSPLDLESCEEWPASREDPICARLYETPEKRWVLDAGCLYLELRPIRAANLLLRWGWPLPGDLGLEWKASQKAETVPTETLPLPVATSCYGLIILYGPHDEPLVKGKPKEALGPIRHKIILTLIEAGEEGLGLIELRKRSGYEGVRGVLTRIAKDPDWGSVIQFPGRARAGGYRIGPPGFRHRLAASN